MLVKKTDYEYTFIMGIRFEWNPHKTTPNFKKDGGGECLSLLFKYFVLFSGDAELLCGCRIRMTTLRGVDHGFHPCGYSGGTGMTA